MTINDPGNSLSYIGRRVQLRALERESPRKNHGLISMPPEDEDPVDKPRSSSVVNLMSIWKVLTSFEGCGLRICADDGTYVVAPFRRPILIRR